MKANDFKKLLSGLSVVSLLAGTAIGTTGCSMTEADNAAEVQHPTPGSTPMNLSS